MTERRTPRMNIAYSKNGKSIKFMPKNFTPTGGDTDAGQLLALLANANPDIDFYIIGRSEFSRTPKDEIDRIFDHDNVIDCYAGVESCNFPAMRDQSVAEGRGGYIVDQPFDTCIVDKLKDIKIDAHIMMCGNIASVTVPNRVMSIREPDQIASVADMARGYSGPINLWGNANMQVPVIEICTDPRYTSAQARDMIFSPKISLSQYDDTYERKHIVKYGAPETTVTEVPRIYAQTEKIFVYRRPAKAPDLKKKTESFAIVLNEGDPSRYNMLNEWVLKQVKDVDIYGEWKHQATQEDSRFKGPMKLEDLHRRLDSVRSSFIIPIAPGWVTAKYIELIYSGVVPFLHPTYDEQNHLDMPAFLRPKTPTELMQRVEMLKDDGIYLKTITALQKKYLTPDLYDGSTLNKIVMEHVESGYKPLSNVSKSKEAAGDSLEEFFS